MRTKSLTFIAGLIWLIAGFNVCRIGVVSWLDLDATTLVMVMGSIDDGRNHLHLSLPLS